MNVLVRHPFSMDCIGSTDCVPSTETVIFQRRIARKTNLDEFEIIARYFGRAYPDVDDVQLGIGDDAAILHVPPVSELLVSMDTLVSGVHFPANETPAAIAHKALAVSLSDMAAMGARPRWLSLSLTLPQAAPNWLEAFSASFNALAKSLSLILIGGDLTRGPLSLTVQIYGIAPKGKSLRRSGARAGDHIYVTGILGAAAYALRCQQIGQAVNADDLKRLQQPEARIATGLALRDTASSCIDISDGLLSDLGHILKAGGVGAEVILDDIPYADSLDDLDRDSAIQLALTGGDDYELCFTVGADLPASAIKRLDDICPISHIGHITAADMNLHLRDRNGVPYTPPAAWTGYRHFHD